MSKTAEQLAGKGVAECAVAVPEKKRRTRKCREIVAVVEHTGDDSSGYQVLSDWPSGIVRKDKAIAAAKKIQERWAVENDACELKKDVVLSDIVLLRRLATVKASSQVMMAFSVE